LSLKTDYKVGVISSGIPISMFSHLDGLNFISLDYNIICEDIVKEFHSRNYQVYTWVVNDNKMMTYMKKCDIDGIISDYYSTSMNHG
jgi:glycerophosphoryl diester phosphodiesterase